MKRVGVISDTHGLLRPEAVEALRGVALILHAGDVGSPEVLAGLRALAPVLAVRGNVDRGPWAEAYPLRQELRVEEVAVLVLHDRADLQAQPAGAGVRVVITGHSHLPSVETRDGVIYLNPGAAGPCRFKLPVTLALLSVDGTEASVEVVDLFCGRAMES